MAYCTQFGFAENLLVLAGGKANEVYSKINQDYCNQPWSWVKWCYILVGISAILIVSSAVTSMLKAGGKYLFGKAYQVVPTRYFGAKIRGRRPISRLYDAPEDYRYSPMKAISRESTSKIIRTIKVRDPTDQHSLVKHRSIAKR